MKRIRPAPMGRAFRYQRRMAHIIVTVAEKRSKAESEQAKATSVSSTDKGKARKRPQAAGAKRPATKKGTKAATK